MTRARYGALGLGVALLSWLLASAPALASPTHLHAPGLGLPSTAHQHGEALGPDIPPPAVVEAGPAPAMPAAVGAAPSRLPLLLAAIGVLALAGMGVRTRRFIPVALTLLVSISAFEQTVHGVHHLGDPREADKCAVLAVSTHVDGTAGAPEPVPTPDLVFAPTLPMPPAPAVHAALVDVPPGRAPPRPSFI